MKQDGLNPRIIRAGNDNLFQSKIFSETFSTLIGQPIEIYNTTGAVGAARAAGLEQTALDSLGESMNDFDKVANFEPKSNSMVYHQAYHNWKTILNNKLNIE